MCRKIILMILTLMIITGCSAPMNFSTEDMDIYEKIHKKYLNMDSYCAKGILTTYSNKTENKYTLLQYYKKPGMYKTEYLNPDGTVSLVFVEKDGVIYISSPSGNEMEFPAKDFPDCTYVNNFFKLYYNSAETSINVSKNENSKNMFLEADIYPISANAKKAIMTIDDSTNIISTEIYDMGNDLRTKLEFTEFDYGADLSDEIFTLR